VEGLAVQRPPLSALAIWREVRVLMGVRGQPVPSPDTVERIIRSMPAALRTLGREGDKAYRDQFDLVLRRESTAPNELWQADHTLLDLTAQRDDGREGRPWLTVITDDYSRAITGFAFSFDAPSALRTSLALRQAIWRKTESHWQCCGIPEALYSDNGSDFTSTHLEQVAVDLKIRLVHSIPGAPRGRGKIERFFRTVNQRFLCHLAGYQKGGRRRPGALLRLPELDERFREFIREYHAEVHSQTGETPLARWTRDGFLPRMPDSLDQLDLLLLTVAKGRMVRSDGVHFAGYRYIDPTLSAYVGESVIIRYDPRDLAEIRLFHGGTFLCRAIAPELAGETIAFKDLVRARNQRRRGLRAELRERQRVVDELLGWRQGVAPSPEPQPRVLESPAKPRIKRYRND
jgi:putative transposase